MIKEGVRVCDVCGQEIVKGKKYCHSTIPRDKIALFKTMLEAESNIELHLTWTENEDGAITLDICLECDINMEDFTPPGYIH